MVAKNEKESLYQKIILIKIKDMLLKVSFIPLNNVLLRCIIFHFITNNIRKKKLYNNFCYGEGVENISDCIGILLDK